MGKLGHVRNAIGEFWPRTCTMQYSHFSRADCGIGSSTGRVVYISAGAYRLYILVRLSWNGVKKARHAAEGSWLIGSHLVCSMRCRASAVRSV